MFIPNKITSGYNNREDTYTGKLAYVIYYDEKDKLRKETSWNSWRKKDLGKDEYANSPIEGFVLNKKVGGTSWSGWNTRQTYTRVYDPRGFEFEISVPNLLFILENTNSIKGKGLEGEFVYGWEGTELWLIPIDAPEYSEWCSTSKILLSNTTVKAKDLVVGHTYMTKQEQEWIYLGRFIEYDSYRQKEDKPMIKKHWFADVKQTEAGANQDRSRWYKNYYESFTSLFANTITSVPQKIVYCIREDIHPEYPELMEALEHQKSFVGLGETTKVKKYSYEDFTKEFGGSMEHYWCKEFFTSDGVLFKIRKNKEDDIFQKYTEDQIRGYWDRKETILATYTSIKDLFDNGDCNYKNDYLSNGKIHRTSRGYNISVKEIIMEEENE